jgi:hypothetical protein
VRPDFNWSQPSVAMASAPAMRGAANKTPKRNPDSFA